MKNATRTFLIPVPPASPTAAEAGVTTHHERAEERRTYAGGMGRIRGQLVAAMAVATTERVERLLDAVIDGEIDGATWRGHTRCPLGWLGISDTGPGSLPPDETYLIEGFAFPVMPGQTPETNGRLRRMERWIVVFLGRRYDAELEAEEAAAAQRAEASA